MLFAIELFASLLQVAHIIGRESHLGFDLFRRFFCLHAYGGRESPSYFGYRANHR